MLPEYIAGEPSCLGFYFSVRETYVGDCLDVPAAIDHSARKRFGSDHWHCSPAVVDSKFHT